MSWYHLINKSSRSLIQKGKVSPMLKIHGDISIPEYAESGVPYSMRSSSEIYKYRAKEIPKVRRAARLARKMLEYANSLVKPGVTTDEIDYHTHNEILKHGAYPSPLNYCGFPKSICTSVNEVVCHGIPDDRILNEGDIISIDISLFIDGYHGDNCGSVPVGLIDDKADNLITITKYAVQKAVEVCGPGRCMTEIGKVIEGVAKKFGYGVVPDFCGHGTGKYLHMMPYVLHYSNDLKQPMKPGMVFTIEPILVEGNTTLRRWNDNWTASTMDGGRAAQIEHEVLITENGHEILTILE